VALKFQYAMFYLKINGIMPEIRRAVKEFLRFVVEDHNREYGTDWNWKEIQVVLNTNSITDDMETMQIIQASKGIVSEKTLLGEGGNMHDIFTDAKRVLARSRFQTTQMVYKDWSNEERQNVSGLLPDTEKTVGG
jgi:hypothetical protein